MYKKLAITFVGDTLTKEQVSKLTAELLDLAVYLILECRHLEEDAYRYVAEAGKGIINKIDDPFTHTQEFAKIRTYLQRCGEIVKQPEFPTHKRAASDIKDFMSDMLKKLAKRGLLEEIYNDVFDLINNTANCTYDEDDYNVRIFSDASYFFRNLPRKDIKKNPELFVAMAKRYSETLEKIGPIFLEQRFARDVLDDGLNKVYGDNKQVAKHWVALLVPLLRHPSEDTMNASFSVVRKDKGFKWKDHTDIADQVFDLIKAFPLPPSDSEMDEKETKKMENLLKKFADTVEYFFEGLKKSKIVKNYSRGMLDLTLKFMKTKRTELFELAEDIAERIDLNPKEDKDIIVEKMKQLHELLQNEDLPWSENWPLLRATNDLIDSCMEPFKDGKVFTDDDLNVFVSICLTCLEHDMIHPETGQCPSPYFSIYLTVMSKLNNWLKALNRMDLAADMIKPLMCGLTTDDDTAVQLCAMYIYLFAIVPSGQKVLGPHLEDIIKAYLDTEQDNLLMAINQAYFANPKAIKTYFPTLMAILEETGKPSDISNIAQLFQNVSKKQAELFRDQDIKILLTKAQDYMDSQPLLLDIVKELCKRRPDIVIPYFDTIRDKSLWNPLMSYTINDMLCTLAIHKKELASVVLDDLLATVKSNQEKIQVVSSFNTMRMIGFKYPELIKPKRSQISAIQLTDVDEVNMKQLILDMIDGKTSDEMINQLRQQQQDLQDLVGRVDETEESIAEVKSELDRQGEDLAGVKMEVGEQGQRLDQVEQTMDETVAKVEDIDQKTLSHAPYWSRDVSKLLNPISEQDWRLLCSRLGYSNDDIRGWAQQSDPCMAMLNEWYATHKTREATFAILTQLQEMDRMDAAIIVENAMKNAEAVVEDEEFEYATPPTIFISYQWAHQPEVKLLKQHLEMAGYDCWLDIGQMGGGDKLFEKIDNGIRAAKIIISCITAKYTKSPNCNREVNLSVNLNKPIIPLLLEKCTWPPPGSMGPIFSEYLFIRFFQRKGEECDDERYWPKDKFQELLMQINMLGLAPLENMICPDYKDWWMPIVEKIKIDKNKTKNGGPALQTDPRDMDKLAAKSPDIFISYQWDKQKNIIKLYERLTSLGLTCWLDIKQMGGGDSLYDKIDKGIRGCNIMLSCVTQKYIISANCRREVSLADALKKPILPLLLEKMTWPPTGPMSMVLTQLLYINFSKDEYIQVIWEGPQFKELIAKIYEHVPTIILVDEKKAEGKDHNISANSESGNGIKSTSGLKALSTRQIQQPSKSNTDPPISVQVLSTSAAKNGHSKIYTQKCATTSTSTSTNRKPQNISTKKSSAAKFVKPAVTKLSAVNKFLVGSKQSPGTPTDQLSKTQPHQLSVSSRPLLRPLPLNPAQKLILSEQSLSQSQPSTSPAQSQKGMPRSTQRPSKLPPLQRSKGNQPKATSSTDKESSLPRAQVRGSPSQAAKQTSK